MPFKLRILFHLLRLWFKPKLNSPDKLKKFQQKGLKKFADQTLRKSRYYQGYFSGNTFLWEQVPQIEKTEFMANFDTINTVGIQLKEAMDIALAAEHSRDFNNEIRGITIGLSTGTSGKRGIFLVSAEERAQWVALVMQRVIKPKLFQKQKVAFFLRANSNLYASVGSSLFEFKYFDIFKPLNELLKELHQYQPDILASQPSVLTDLALAQKNHQIQIQPVQIISFAEVLHAHEKESISSIFNVPITEVYQCTEGFLGVSCSHGTMHLNEDLIQIEPEWIDEQYFYPVITDFSRTSQPVVQYKLNDVLQIKGSPCSCGSPFMAIEKIIGRDDDILILNKQKIYPDLIARRIAMQTDSFQKYRIEQVNSNSLMIRLDCKKEDFEKLTIVFTQVLENLFRNFQLSNIQLKFSEDLPLITGNKSRKIIRLSYED